MAAVITLLYVVVTVGLSLGPFFVLARLYGWHKPGRQKFARRWWHLAAAYGVAWIGISLFILVDSEVYKWIRDHILNSHQILTGLFNGFLILLFVLPVIFFIIPYIFHKKYKLPKTIIQTIFLSFIGLILGLSLFVFVIILGFYSLNYEPFL